MGRSILFINLTSIYQMVIDGFLYELLIITVANSIIYMYMCDQSVS